MREIVIAPSRAASFLLVLGLTMVDRTKRTIQIALSPFALVALGLVILIPWVLALHPHWLLREAGDGGAGGSITRPHAEVQSGPWGTLQIEPIILDYPSSCAIYDFDPQPYRVWTFRNSSNEEIRKRLEGSGIQPDAVHELMQTAVSDPGIRGAVLHPPDAIVRTFSPSLRAALHVEFGRNPDQPVRARPFMFRGKSVSEWFFHSGVRREIIKQIEPLVFRREEFLVFADPQLVMAAIPSRAERVALYRALHRTATYRLRISLTEGEQPGETLAYWCHPNREAAIEPLATALGAPDDGLSVIYFLPSFARTRLYTYPPVQETKAGPPRDCHWTSLNFFNEVPDDSRSGATIGAILPREYDPIQVPTHLGDLVLLFSGQQLVHSCVYVAADVVFTKNGLGAGDPFVFEKTDDVIRRYRCIYGEIHLGFCRRKGT